MVDYDSLGKAAMFFMATDEGSFAELFRGSRPFRYGMTTVYEHLVGKKLIPSIKNKEDGLVVAATEESIRLFPEPELRVQSIKAIMAYRRWQYRLFGVCLCAIIYWGIPLKGIWEGL